MGSLKQINARIPEPLYQAISERALLVEETPAGYLRRIVEFWAARDCPPVTLYEQKLLAGRAAKPPRGQGSDQASRHHHK